MSDLILYTTEDGQSRIQLRADGQTAWITQLDMSDLFTLVGCGEHSEPHRPRSAVRFVPHRTLRHSGLEPVLLEWRENP
jgi:hypothetical protein